MSKSKGRQHGFTAGAGMPDSDDIVEMVPEEQVPEDLQHEPITMPETLQEIVKPASQKIRYECLEHPEQGMEVVLNDGRRKIVPICPCCGYQMVEVAEQKKFQRR